MRLHSFDGVREPWKYAASTLDICRRFFHLRMRLLPVTRKLVDDAHQSGVTPCRPMWFEFDDEDAYRCVGQYMLGPSLLVAPVVRGDSRASYWLPPGRWHDAFSSRTETGPTWIDETVDADVIPLWLRDGAELELCEPAPRVAAALAGPRRTVRGGHWA
jgi:alpha-D-xyloside xylohydrolase